VKPDKCWTKYSGAGDRMIQDGSPVPLARNYTQAEKVADGFIHVIGLAFAVCGGVTLVVLSSRSAS